MQLCRGRGDWTSPERDEADQPLRREAFAGEKYNDTPASYGDTGEDMRHIRMYDNSFARGIAISVLCTRRCRITRIALSSNHIYKGPYFPVQDSYTA